MLSMNVENAVDGCCGLKDVIIWNVDHAVAVLVLILPGCGLCEAVNQEPLCAFVGFDVDTIGTCVLGLVAAVDDSQVPVCILEVCHPPEQECDCCEYGMLQWVCNCCDWLLVHSSNLSGAH